MSKTKYNLPKVEELLDAGVHFGHQVKRWSPKMAPYIFSHRKGIHIIDLEQTHKMLEKACEFLFETAKEGGKAVIVGTKKQAATIVKDQAVKAGVNHVTDRWLGGTLTNFDVIRLNVDALLRLKKKFENNEVSHYTKKEKLLMERQIEKLEKSVGGIVAMNRVPGVMVVVDAKREATAVKEAKRLGLKVVAIVDTNTNPEGIDYIVPANDDAIRSVSIIVTAFADALEAGYKVYAENAASAGKKAAEAVEAEAQRILDLEKVELAPEVEALAEKLEEEILEETTEA